MLPKITWIQVHVGKSSKMVPNMFYNDFNTSWAWRSPQVQQYLCFRLLMQAIRVKLSVEVAVTHDESSPNHLWN